MRLFKHETEKCLQKIIKHSFDFVRIFVVAPFWILLLFSPHHCTAFHESFSRVLLLSENAIRKRNPPLLSVDTTRHWLVDFFRYIHNVWGRINREISLLLSILMCFFTKKNSFFSQLYPIFFVVERRLWCLKVMHLWSATKPKLWWFQNTYIFK